MLLLKNFVSKEFVDQALAVSSKSPDWKLSSEMPNSAIQNMLYDAVEHVPCRLTANVKDYPIVKEFFYEKFDRKNFFAEDIVYFSKYVTGTDCKKHYDPSVYTVIVLLQKADIGGNLMVEEEKIKNIPLNIGDAVIFKGSSHHFITEVLKGTRIALTLWLNDIPDKYKFKLSGP